MPRHSTMLQILVYFTVSKKNVIFIYVNIYNIYIDVYTKIPLAAPPHKRDNNIWGKKKYTLPPWQIEKL